MPQQEPPFGSDVAPPKEDERLASAPRGSLRASKKRADGAGRAVGGAWLSKLVEDRSSTRLLTYLAVGGFAFLLAIAGMWTWFRSHHPEGVPVIGPPPYAVKDRPADPGGMMIMGDDTVKGDVTGRGAVHLAPPPEQPDARLLAGRVESPSSPVVGSSAAGELRDETGKTETVSSEGKDSHARAALPSHDDGAQPVKTKEQAEAMSGQRTSDAARAPALPNPAPLPPPLSEGEEQKEQRDKVHEATVPQESAAEKSGEGAYEVQLAALPDEAQARKEWEHLRRKSPDLLGERTPVFRSVERGGKSFVRVRVGGFADRAAARQFCVRLHAQAQACSVAASH